MCLFEVANKFISWLFVPITFQVIVIRFLAVMKNVRLGSILKMFTSNDKKWWDSWILLGHFINFVNYESDSGDNKFYLTKILIAPIRRISRVDSLLIKKKKKPVFSPLSLLLTIFCLPLLIRIRRVGRFDEPCWPVSLQLTAAPWAIGMSRVLTNCRDGYVLIDNPFQ